MQRRCGGWDSDMPERHRVDRVPAFVLHAYPYSETSLLVEAFTRTHGRLPLVAKGARRPGSGLRPVLLAFRPLIASWSGRGEVRTLARCEWQGGGPSLRGEALLCGFYLNELLLRLLPREDPHELLFDHYAMAMIRLGTEPDAGSALRAFERRLLQEVGYALALEREADTGAPIDPDRLYAYDPERGAVRAGEGVEADDRLVVSGRVLLEIARDDYAAPATAQAAKQLMRLAINRRLDRQPLHSRAIFKELASL
jgi:DNA repair protein RecO (recombination protein O)